MAIYLCQILPCALIKYMAMTRDRSCKFRKFSNFWPNSTLNNRKSHKISGGKKTLVQKLSAKNLTGGAKHPLPTRVFRANYFYNEITQSHSHTIAITLPGLLIMSAVGTDGGL